MILPTTVVLAYLTAVRLLRYRRMRDIQRKYSYTTRESFSRMTLDDAWAVQVELSTLEFPRIYGVAIFFALFKTYGIPTISSLLVHTTHLTQPSTASKRAADTGILLTEVVLNPPSSPRSAAAIARINSLHHPYLAGSKISNDDMLYTLSLFALEPTRWIRKYEWRVLTDIENCAVGTYWRALGERLGVGYEGLKEVKDGLEWLEEVDRWSKTYETELMRPAESNKLLAGRAVDILLFTVPSWARGVADKFVTSLLEERLRIAIGFPIPPPPYPRLLHLLLTLRKLTVRHLLPPRPSFLRFRFIPDAPDPKTGRFSAVRYRAHPWYIKPTFWARWGVRAWWTWAVGGVVPGDGGERYFPEGYLVEEVGPGGTGGLTKEAETVRYRRFKTALIPYNHLCSQVTYQEGQRNLRSTIPPCVEIPKSRSVKWILAKAALKKLRFKR
ncbi:MAG: hypothetical protein M1840_008334 [Geoglossum simile]|nr:MAG: hypothetical protein M1840_008334 [Geoglossum simile]